MTETTAHVVLTPKSLLVHILVQLVHQNTSNSSSPSSVCFSYVYHQLGGGSLVAHSLVQLALDCHLWCLSCIGAHQSPDAVVRSTTAANIDVTSHARQLSCTLACSLIVNMLKNMRSIKNSTSFLASSNNLVNSGQWLFQEGRKLLWRDKEEFLLEAFMI